jgi:hypothetical protein
MASTSNLHDERRWQKYDRLAEAKARRIGHSLDRNTWFAVCGLDAPCAFFLRVSDLSLTTA